MTIKVEKNLRDFEFWGGAKGNANLLTPDELDQLEEIIDSMDLGEGWTDTQINDMMWFEFDVACDWLGIELDEDGEPVRE